MNYETILKEIALEDERIVVLTAENRAAIRGLPSVLGPRFIDTGITEQAMIGASAGLALRGRLPIAHALAAFLTMRAFEFARTDVGISGLPVKLVGYVPGFLSEANGPTHQAVEDVSLMRGIPNMRVFCPADEADMVLMLPAFFAAPYPAYLRYITLKNGFEHKENFTPGQAEVVSEGADVTILTYGALFKEALKAKARLEEEKLSVGLVNLRTLKPIDEKALATALKSRLVVTLEDHFLTGGLYTILAEFCFKNQLTARILPFALDEKWFKPALLEDLIAYEGFNGEAVAEKILNELR